ncbi:MAG: hypothetical protein ACXVP0_09265 [Bacteroidia bacterium]
MKKITILSVCAIALSFASCKKDRTCECTDSTGAVYSSFIIHDTKSKAQSLCSAYATAGSGSACNIK